MRALVCAVSLLFASVADAALAQGQHASIEGDVYLVMQSGDVRRMAASHVYLVSREAPPLNPLCAARDSATASYLRALRDRRGARDSVRTLRGRDRVEWQRRADSTASAAAVAARVRRGTVETIVQALRAQPEAATGMAAHYSFGEVAPGSYALFSDTNLPYFWFVRVEIRAGQQSRDLDNNNVTPVPTDTAVSIADAVCAFAALRASLDRTPDTISGAEERPQLLNLDEVRRDVSHRLSRFPGSSLSVVLMVDESGAVDPNTIEVFGASGSPNQEMIEDAAALVAERMRFRPGTVNGSPAKVWVLVPLSVSY